DIDGHINSRGLFEYSTVSKNLFNDVMEICRGLGISINCSVNNNRSGGYSNAPIYRITQLSGYKHGIKIVGIVLTDEYTEMQCIKVSNDDHLYFTDDYILTHNTTTATVLAEAIFTEGQKLMGAGHDPMSLKRGIDKAVEKIVESLQDQSRPVDTTEDIRQVATISSNGEKAVGDMVAEAMEKVGNNGIITLEEGKGFESRLRLSDGFEFDRGFTSAYFMTPQEVEQGRQRCVFDDARIWVIDGKLNSQNQMKEMIPTLELCVNEGKAIVIIAESIEDVVLNTLAINAAQGKLSCVAIKSPGFGASRKEMLEDLAILTGATVRDPAHVESVTKEVKTDELGYVKRIEVYKDRTVLIGEEGREEKIRYQCEKIRGMLDQLDSTWDRDQQEKRLAKLTGGVAVIEVGAPTEVAMKERRDRIEDALSATKAAIAEGIVAGGGVALVRASNVLKGFSTKNPEEDFGVGIVRKAVQEPLKHIVDNAGGTPDVVVAEVLKSKTGKGYDALKREYCDMFNKGIVDPTKVVRVALQNAADVAGLLLTTECVVSLDESTKDPTPSTPMMYG
ncbi:MAG: Hsp60 family chaperonin, partial [Candidatus Kariarchaeaceae archaeon]